MEDGKLTHSMLSSQDTQTPLENVRYEDGNISFEVTREWNGRKFTTPYTGRVAGSAIQARHNSNDAARLGL